MAETKSPVDDRKKASFPVVGIGASAGGLGALSKFFEAVPEKSGMAFVVIVHLDPNHESHMAALLQRVTAMRVRQVTRSTRLQADEVYIIPPDKDLTLSDGHFRLSPRATPNRSRAPIDGFFKTLAETHSSGALAIVLSGTGSDGTQGIKWIKERGGITMAQSPDEAEYRSMPASAIATGCVDVVLPVQALASETIRLASESDLDLPATEGADDKTDDGMIKDILALVRTRKDHDFSGYKRSTIGRRINRRAQFSHSPDLAAYLALIRENQRELSALYDDLLISVTNFFRDAESFASLERNVVPGLFDNKEDGPIRVWVTGCSTGEEAYSIGIVLCEYAETLSDPREIQIFATDVHERNFAFARQGLYPENIAQDVSAQRLERFFTRETGGYRIKKIVREKVIFAAHNLLRDPPFLKIDLLHCRNLLIYLQRDTQRRVLQLFHFSLRPGGTLFLGTSESVEDASKMFAVIDKRHRIFRSLDVPRRYLSPLMERRGGAVKRLPGRDPERVKVGESFSDVHRRLLEAYAPPSLVVNAAGDVVHLSDSVGQYLQIGGGEPSRGLAEMLPPAARVKIRKLIRKVLDKGESGLAAGVPFTIGGKRRQVDLIARPLPGAAESEAFALIVFDESADSGETGAASSAVKNSKRRPAQARALEQDLEDTRAQLASTLEEHEAAMEELKASNEEFQSINEEQRATEEELEASKEELQSINEELNTINQEFRTKHDQLAELNSDLINLIDSTGIATIFLDRNLRVRRFTPAATPLFNLLASDTGRPLSDLAHLLDYPDLTTDAMTVLRTLVRSDREVLAKDGRWFVARISAYRAIDERIDGVVISLFETTERKIAEMDRETLLTEVQATSVAKSDFIGVMSHELRTPLNAIIGYADILSVGAVGEVSTEQLHHLDRIKASATHLTHMIDDALQSVRIEAGITSLDNESVNVGEIVRDVAMVTAPLMGAKGLDFIVAVEDGPNIVTDATRVRQILFNLLGNAVRYTDTGSVSISSKVDEHGATIVIEDTGIGISVQNLEKIFERFWQVDQSKTRVRGGTGLGLMVSRSLARLMGGELQVSSELGRGSRFVIRLPVAPPEASHRAS